MTPAEEAAALRAEQAKLRAEEDRLERRRKASIALESALTQNVDAEQLARRRAEYEAAALLSPAELADLAVLDDLAATAKVVERRPLFARVAAMVRRGAGR